MKVSRQCVISISIIVCFIIILAAVILARTNAPDKNNAGQDSTAAEQLTMPETRQIETIDAAVESDSITVKLVSWASDDDIKELMRDIGAASLSKVNGDTYKVIFREDHDPSELGALAQKALTHAIVEDCSLTYAQQ